MATPEINLQGLRILITRPKPQAYALSQILEHAGAQTILLPSIEIAPPTQEQQQQLDNIIAQLDQYDIAIFISPTTVIKTIPLIRNAWNPLPTKTSLAAIGAGTKAALHQYNLSVKLCPSHHYSSNALLGLPELQRLSGKRIVIFCGENSRTELASALNQRGAIVTNAIAYRRILPSQSPITQILKDWQQNGIDVIISTSYEGLKNLFTLLSDAGKALLLCTPIVGISDAMAQFVQAQGCHYPLLLAENATNNAILDTIKRWKDAHDRKANQ